MRKIYVYDDDKRGVVGVGRCGGDNDMVDVSPLDNLRSMHLIVDTENNNVYASNTEPVYDEYFTVSGHTFGVGTPTIRSSLNGVVGRIGTVFEVSGNRSGEHHVAAMQLTIDLQ